MIERTIGNLTEEMKQPSKPYANLSQRGLRRAQVNALKSMIPLLERKKGNPRGSIDLGGGFVLLRARDRTMQTLRGDAAIAVRTYMHDQTGDDVANWNPRVFRWARLHLPTGQVVRSAWKEKTKSLEKVRMSRNVRVSSIIHSCLC